MVSNFKTAAKYSIVYGVLIIVFIVLFIFGITNVYYRKIYLNISALSFIVYLILLLRKPHYFSLREEKDMIIIDFYNPHPLIQNYSKIKIPKDEYDGYELRSLGFLRQEIIFKIRKGKRVGKYPPVSITALTKSEKQELFNYLDSLDKHKNTGNKN